MERKPPRKPNMTRVKAGTSKAAAKERRARFVEAYITNGGNATQAAITAGFSARRARATGAEIVAERSISEEIERRRAKLLAEKQAETGMTIERTLREIARIAYADVRKLYRPDGTIKPMAEWDDDTAATVAGLENVEFTSDGQVTGRLRKLKHWDKVAALDKAMRYLRLYPQGLAGEEEQPPQVTERTDDLEIARRILFVAERFKRQQAKALPNPAKHHREVA